jgi:hypothetical protein
VTEPTNVDHEAVLDRAWRDPANTAVDLPPVPVNQVLRERYRVEPPVAYTVDSLWDMEVRKASAPDVYIPTVVKPGSVERFPSVRHGRFEDFTRISEQRLWLRPDTYGVVIEHVRLDHDRHRAFFLGAERFETPDGRTVVAGTGQPVFHVEHSVAGPAGDPLNLWRIVHLTPAPDPAITELFDELGRAPYLRVFVEVYLREVLHADLTRI